MELFYLIKDPNDKQKVKNVRNKEQLKKINFTITSYFKSKIINFDWPRGWNSSKTKKEDGFVDTPKSKWNST